MTDGADTVADDRAVRPEQAPTAARENRFDEALALAKGVARAQPRHPAYLVSLAKVDAGSGEFDQALNAFLAASAAAKGASRRSHGADRRRSRRPR